MASKADYRKREHRKTHERMESDYGFYYVPKKSEAERSLERVEKVRQADEPFLEWYWGEGGADDGDGGPEEGPG